jgi:hypothetical protein
MTNNLRTDDLPPAWERSCAGQRLARGRGRPLDATLAGVSSRIRDLAPGRPLPACQPAFERAVPFTWCSLSGCIVEHAFSAPADGQTTYRPAAADAPMVDAAADLAEYLLRENRERRRHSEAVAERAMLLTAAVPDEETPLLVAAAWLHDIGYADQLRQVGFHPLDGGLHLRELGWPDAVCALVAHHSGARFVATVRGVDDQLAQFEHRDHLMSDALTVADQTVGPEGRSMTVSERMADVLSRHDPDSPNAKAHPERRPYLLSAAARVADRLEKAGIGPDRHRIF